MLSRSFTAVQTEPLTSRSPSGVQASTRASGTRATTRAVQPGGTVSRCGVDSAPPPSPAGTTSVVVDTAAADGPVVEGPVVEGPVAAGPGAGGGGGAGADGGWARGG